MATNTFRFLLAVLIFALPLSLFAQDAGYYSVTEGGQTRFYQRLTWSGGEYALRYEVVIERIVEGRYRAHLRDFTASLFIVVSLPPGDYRFRVIPYDVLDRPGTGSPWVNLEVRHAVRPELMGMSSGFYSSGIDDQPSGYVLEIEGNDIVPGAEVFIRPPDGTLIPAETLSFGEGTDVIIFVDDDKATPGEYDLVVRNPGGLESSVGGIVLKEPGKESVYQPKPEPVVVNEPEMKQEPKAEEEHEQEPSEDQKFGFDPLRPFLVGFGAAWTPVAPLHGEYIDGEFYPFSLYTEKEMSIFGVYFNVVFSTPMDIYIGPEVKGFLYIDINDEYFLIGGVNLLAMKWMANQRMAFKFSPGVSFVLVPEIENSLMIDIGFSIILRVSNELVLEIGTDYVNFLREENPVGFLRPWIGAGFLF